MRLRAGWCGVLLAAVLVVGASGCGFIGAHDTSTHGVDRTGTARTIADGTQTITVVGNERMTFVPNVIKAHTGRLRIVLKVTGNTPHNLQVSRLHANTGMVEKGKPGSVTVDLRRPGRYDFVCTYHVKEGMTGVIDVS
jgi:plastocyanin